MLNMKKIFITFTTLFPSLTFAQSQIASMLYTIRTNIGLLVPVIFGLSVVYFFWGTAQFILSAGDIKTREDGRNKMIWGVIVIFVFASLAGILSLVGDLVGINP